MEYVCICLARVEQASFDAGEASKIGDMTMAKARMFDIETWLKVAKKDFKREMPK